MIRSTALLAPLAALALGACTPAGQTAEARSDTGSGACSAEAATRLAGRAAPGEAEVKRLTGAGIVRRIAPGDPVTMDFNERRVTIEVDARGIVARASCG